MPNPGVRERRRPPMIRRFGSDAPIKFRLFQDYCATDAGLLTFEVLLGTAEQSAQRAGHEVDHSDDYRDHDCGDQPGCVRMAGGEPGQAKSEGVFAEAEGDIREWFRRRGDGGADCGFTAM